MPQLPPRYEPLRCMVENHLETVLVQIEQRGIVPMRLMEAIRYSLLAPGKRVRPILTLLAYEACLATSSLTLSAALPAAAAVEMIHTYSLIHDDLPAMDDDDLRRGRPTCHKAFDEATAILAGDALLTLAFQVLAEQGQHAASCIADLASAAGLLGMVGGQMDDILHEGQTTGTLDLLRSIHARKTGALLKAAVTMGARIGLQGNTSDPRFAALCTYADALGLAFQIADDLLDIHSDAVTMGKATQKDAGQGKLTYPGLLGLEGAQRELQQAHLTGLQALASLGDAGRDLSALLTYVVERDR
ncbi:MAG TPA: polyprenyl synthetase family protein [Gemmatales bacterium]|nr:polyprenyl synthetase family protein [Gemmatales bacterium]